MIYTVMFDPTERDLRMLKSRLGRAEFRKQRRGTKYPVAAKTGFSTRDEAQRFIELHVSDGSDRESYYIVDILEERILTQRRTDPPPRCSLLICVRNSAQSGECYTHGAWSLCSEHRSLVGAPPLEACPICLEIKWQESEQEEEDSEVEAVRRNVEQERRDREDRLRYEDQFHVQGYGSEAVQALINKQLSIEGGSRRHWMAHDIEREREAREREQKIATGKLAPCPHCGRYAPIAQGVILAHDVGPWDQHIWCSGEGTVIGSA